MIWKLADLLEAHADEFAQLETLDNGKPIRQARNRDIPGAIALFRYMAGWATKIEGAAIPFAEAEIDTYHAYTRLYDQQAAINARFQGISGEDQPPDSGHRLGASRLSGWRGPLPRPLPDAGRGASLTGGKDCRPSWNL